MKKYIISGLLLVLVLFYGPSGLACSTFRDTSGRFIGKSFDWSVDHLMAIKHAKGTQRKTLALVSGQRKDWEVKYDNLTLSQIAPGLPYEGINEKGLSIQILWLNDSTYETLLPSDPRIEVNELEWIQYHLDNYASVKEILEDATALETPVPLEEPASPPSTLVQQTYYRQNAVKLQKVFANVHFFVCDPTSLCATFEWISLAPSNEGLLLVSQLKNRYAPEVITNDNYRDSFAHYRRTLGVKDVSQGLSSLQRFVRLARGRLETQENSVASMFDLLASVEQFPTEDYKSVWQSVYDVEEKALIVKHYLSEEPLRMDFEVASSALPQMRWLYHKQGRPDESFLDYSQETHLKLFKLGTQTLGLQETLGGPQQQALLLSSYP